VKMSRARERSTVYVVADSPEQAADDLRRSWSASRRIGWAIDQGTPAPGRDAEPTNAKVSAVSASLRHARLVSERAAVAAAIPSDPGDAAYYRARSTVEGMERKLRDLDKAEGWGEWKGTPVGEAAAAWSNALREWRGSLAQAEHAGLRERHRLRQQAARAAESEGPLRSRFEALAAPERATLRAELPVAQRELEEINGSRRAYRHFELAHPETFGRLDFLDHQIATAAWELDVERQGLDGIRAEPPRHQARERRFGRDARGLDRGLDLGISL
jgi:hypothetical protein